MLGLGTIAKKVFGTPMTAKSNRSVHWWKDQRAGARVRGTDRRGHQAKDAELAERAQGGESLMRCCRKRLPTAARRRAVRLGLRAFDTQLMGGIFLHQGNISEMKTGEGKTLVATFPAYLNALSGKGVHVVTVNDYLAKRDAEWMSKVYARWA